MSKEQEINYDEVGLNTAHVSAAPAELAAGIDESLGLQPISIRLQKDLIEKLKELAVINGLSYQPLIRQVLTRWVDCEMKAILRDKAAEHRAQHREAQQAAATAPSGQNMRKAA